MLQVSTRDETFLKQNSVMTLRHSRKRDKVYLRKLFYLRNFLNLLQVYRFYLWWKFRKRLKLAIGWRHREAIAWKQNTIKWSKLFYQPDTDTTVIFRCYRCQLMMTYLIKSPRLFSFHISAVDKIFNIFSGRETLRKNLFAVSERFDDDSIEICERLEKVSCVKF